MGTHITARREVDPATILAVLRARLEAESASDDLSDYGAGRRELADDLLDLLDGDEA